MNKRTLLLYDATCRFCELGSNSVLKFLPAGTLQRADVNDSVIQHQYHISREAAQREMYLVNTNGQVSHGIWAIAELLRLSRWAWPLEWLWHIPGFTFVGQRLYLWIADHRYLIMGRVHHDNDCEDGACSIHLGQSNK
jgi:predicted DCC family thiol-disulfide oxidoreductase YuxK